MSSKTVSFCVGTGRCGTTFITELAGLDAEVAASHERMRLAACFHMYCKWHHIAADSEGFFVERDKAVADDLREHRVSFESSALLSHSIAELHARYDAKFLLLVRRPDETVASFAARGWFLDPIAWNDTNLPPTIPDGANPRHFFGRNLPRGEEFARWSSLSQIGKLGWFWQARNRAILEQFRALPATHCRILRLEDFDRLRWQETAAFLGWKTEVSQQAFGELQEGKPNAGPNAPLATETWSQADIAEFEGEVEQVAGALGYEHRLTELRGGQSPLLAPCTVESALSSLQGS